MRLPARSPFQERVLDSDLREIRTLQAASWSRRRSVVLVHGEVSDADASVRNRPR